MAASRVRVLKRALSLALAISCGVACRIDQVVDYRVRNFDEVCWACGHFKIVTIQLVAAGAHAVRELTFQKTRPCRMDLRRLVRVPRAVQRYRGKLYRAREKTARRLDRFSGGRLARHRPNLLWARRGHYVDDRRIRCFRPFSLGLVRAIAALNLLILQERHRFFELTPARQPGNLAHIDPREAIHGFELSLEIFEARIAGAATGEVVVLSLGNAAGQGRLHSRAGMKDTENLHGGDGGARQLRRHVASDAGEPEHLDL